jgi:DNA-binding transcriptional ArsR family regulator
MRCDPPVRDSEETLFLKAFGIKSPVLRILDFLMDNKAYDYSKTDIAKGAGISRTTLSSAWENLEKTGLVRETREVGRAKMYKLNLKNLRNRADNAIQPLRISAREARGRIRIRKKMNDPQNIIA